MSGPAAGNVKKVVTDAQRDARTGRTAKTKAATHVNTTKVEITRLDAQRVPHPDDARRRQQLVQRLKREQVEVRQAQHTIDKAEATVAAGNTYLYSQQAQVDKVTAGQADNALGRTRTHLDTTLPASVRTKLKQEGAVLSTTEIARLNPEQKDAYDAYVKARNHAQQTAARYHADVATANHNYAQLQNYVSDPQRYGSAGQQGANAVNKVLPLGAGLSVPRKIDAATARKQLLEAGTQAATADAAYEATGSIERYQQASQPVTDAQVDLSRAQQAYEAWQAKNPGVMAPGNTLELAVNAAERRLNQAQGNAGSAIKAAGVDRAVKLGYYSMLQGQQGIADAQQQVDGLKQQLKGAQSDTTVSYMQTRLETAQHQLKLARQTEQAYNLNFDAAYAQQYALQTDYHVMQLQREVRYTGLMPNDIGNRTQSEFLLARVDNRAAHDIADLYGARANQATADLNVAFAQENVRLLTQQATTAQAGSRTWNAAHPELQAPGNALEQAAVQARNALKAAQAQLHGALDQQLQARAGLLNLQFEQGLPDKLRFLGPHAGEADRKALAKAQNDFFSKHKDALTGILSRQREMFNGGKWMDWGKNGAIRNADQFTQVIKAAVGSTDPNAVNAVLDALITAGGDKPPIKVESQILLGENAGMQVVNLIEVKGKDGKTYYIDDQGIKYDTKEDFLTHTLFSPDDKLLSLSGRHDNGSLKLGDTAAHHTTWQDRGDLYVKIVEEVATDPMNIAMAAATAVSFAVGLVIPPVEGIAMASGALLATDVAAAVNTAGAAVKVFRAIDISAKLVMDGSQLIAGGMSARREWTLFDQKGLDGLASVESAFNVLGMVGAVGGVGSLTGKFGNAFTPLHNPADRIMDVTAGAYTATMQLSETTAARIGQVAAWTSRIGLTAFGAQMAVTGAEILSAIKDGRSDELAQLIIQQVPGMLFMAQGPMMRAAGRVRYAGDAAATVGHGNKAGVWDNLTSRSDPMNGTLWINGGKHMPVSPVRIDGHWVKVTPDGTLTVDGKPLTSDGEAVKLGEGTLRFGQGKQGTMEFLGRKVKLDRQGNMSTLGGEPIKLLEGGGFPVNRGAANAGEGRTAADIVSTLKAERAAQGADVENPAAGQPAEHNGRGKTAEFRGTFAAGRIVARAIAERGGTAASSNVATASNQAAQQQEDEQADATGKQGIHAEQLRGGRQDFVDLDAGTFGVAKRSAQAVYGARVDAEGPDSATPSMERGKHAMTNDHAAQGAHADSEVTHSATSLVERGRHAMVNDHAVQGAHADTEILSRASLSGGSHHLEENAFTAEEDRPRAADQMQAFGTLAHPQRFSAPAAQHQADPVLAGGSGRHFDTAHENPVPSPSTNDGAEWAHETIETRMEANGSSGAQANRHNGRKASSSGPNVEYTAKDESRVARDARSIGGVGRSDGDGGAGKNANQGESEDGRSLSTDGGVQPEEDAPKAGAGASREPAHAADLAAARAEAGQAQPSARQPSGAIAQGRWSEATADLQDAGASIDGIQPVTVEIAGQHAARPTEPGYVVVDGAGRIRSRSYSNRDEAIIRANTIGGIVQETGPELAAATPDTYTFTAEQPAEITVRRSETNATEANPAIAEGQLPPAAMTNTRADSSVQTLPFMNASDDAAFRRALERMSAAEREMLAADAQVALDALEGSADPIGADTARQAKLREAIRQMSNPGQRSAMARNAGSTIEYVKVEQLTGQKSAGLAATKNDDQPQGPAASGEDTASHAAATADTGEAASTGPAGATEEQRIAAASEQGGQKQEQQQSDEEPVEAVDDVSAASDNAEAAVDRAWTEAADQARTSDAVSSAQNVESTEATSETNTVFDETPHLSMSHAAWTRLSEGAGHKIRKGMDLSKDQAQLDFGMAEPGNAVIIELKPAALEKIAKNQKIVLDDVAAAHDHAGKIYPADQSALERIAVRAESERRSREETVRVNTSQKISEIKAWEENALHSGNIARTLDVEVQRARLASNRATQKAAEGHRPDTRQDWQDLELLAREANAATQQARRTLRLSERLLREARERSAESEDLAPLRRANAQAENAWEEALATARRFAELKRSAAEKYHALQEFTDTLRVDEGRVRNTVHSMEQAIAAGEQARADNGHAAVAEKVLRAAAKRLYLAEQSTRRAHDIKDSLAGAGLYIRWDLISETGVAAAVGASMHARQKDRGQDTFASGPGNAGTHVEQPLADDRENYVEEYRMATGDLAARALETHHRMTVLQEAAGILQDKVAQTESDTRKAVTHASAARAAMHAAQRRGDAAPGRQFDAGLVKAAEAATHAERQAADLHLQVMAAHLSALHDTASAATDWAYAEQQAIAGETRVARIDPSIRAAQALPADADAVRIARDAAAGRMRQLETMQKAYDAAASRIVKLIDPPRSIREHIERNAAEYLQAMRLQDHVQQRHDEGMVDAGIVKAAGELVRALESRQRQLEDAGENGYLVGLADDRVRKAEMNAWSLLRATGDDRLLEAQATTYRFENAMKHNADTAAIAAGSKRIPASEITARLEQERAQQRTAAADLVTMARVAHDRMTALQGRTETLQDEVTAEAAALKEQAAERHFRLMTDHLVASREAVAATSDWARMEREAIDAEMRFDRTERRVWAERAMIARKIPDFMLAARAEAEVGGIDGRIAILDKRSAAVERIATAQAARWEATQRAYHEFAARIAPDKPLNDQRMMPEAEALRVREDDGDKWASYELKTPVSAPERAAHPGGRMVYRTPRPRRGNMVNDFAANLDLWKHFRVRLKSTVSAADDTVRAFLENHIDAGGARGKDNYTLVKDRQEFLDLSGAADEFTPRDIGHEVPRAFIDRLPDTPDATTVYQLKSYMKDGALTIFTVLHQLARFYEHEKYVEAVSRYPELKEILLQGGASHVLEMLVRRRIRDMVPEQNENTGLMRKVAARLGPDGQEILLRARYRGDQAAIDQVVKMLRLVMDEPRQIADLAALATIWQRVLRESPNTKGNRYWTTEAEHAVIRLRAEGILTEADSIVIDQASSPVSGTRAETHRHGMHALDILNRVIGVKRFEPANRTSTAEHSYSRLAEEINEAMQTGRWARASGLAQELRALDQGTLMEYEKGSPSLLVENFEREYAQMLRRDLQASENIGNNLFILSKNAYSAAEVENARNKLQRFKHELTLHEWLGVQRLGRMLSQRLPSDSTGRLEEILPRITVLAERGVIHGINPGSFSLRDAQHLADQARIRIVSKRGEVVVHPRRKLTRSDLLAAPASPDNLETYRPLSDVVTEMQATGRTSEDGYVVESKDLLYGDHRDYLYLEKLSQALGGALALSTGLTEAPRIFRPAALQKRFRRLHDAAAVSGERNPARRTVHLAGLTNFATNPKVIAQKVWNEFQASLQRYLPNDLEAAPSNTTIYQNEDYINRVVNEGVSEDSARNSRGYFFPDGKHGIDPKIHPGEIVLREFPNGGPMKLAEVYLHELGHYVQHRDYLKVIERLNQVFRHLIVHDQMPAADYSIMNIFVEGGANVLKEIVTGSRDSTNNYLDQTAIMRAIVNHAGARTFIRAFIWGQARAVHRLADAAVELGYAARNETPEGPSAPRMMQMAGEMSAPDAMEPKQGPNLQARIRNTGEGEFEITVRGGRIEGMISDKNGKAVISIDHLKVDQASQRRGVGTFLVAELAREAIRRGVDTLVSDIVHPSALRNRGRIFGEENLVFIEMRHGKDWILPITLEQAASSIERAEQAADAYDETGAWPDDFSSSMDVRVDLTSKAVRRRLGLSTEISDSSPDPIRGSAVDVDEPIVYRVDPNRPREEQLAELEEEVRRVQEGNSDLSVAVTVHSATREAAQAAADRLYMPVFDHVRYDWRHPVAPRKSAPEAHGVVSEQVSALQGMELSGEPADFSGFAPGAADRPRLPDDTGDKLFRANIDLLHANSDYELLKDGLAAARLKAADLEQAGGKEYFAAEHAAAIAALELVRGEHSLRLAEFYRARADQGRQRFIADAARKAKARRKALEAAHHAQAEAHRLSLQLGRVAGRIDVVEQTAAGWAARLHEISEIERPRAVASAPASGGRHAVVESIGERLARNAMESGEVEKLVALIENNPDKEIDNDAIEKVLALEDALTTERRRLRQAGEAGDKARSLQRIATNNPAPDMLLRAGGAAESAAIALRLADEATIRTDETLAVVEQIGKNENDGARQPGQDTAATYEFAVDERKWLEQEKAAAHARLKRDGADAPLADLLDMADEVKAAEQAVRDAEIVEAIRVAELDAVRADAAAVLADAEKTAHDLALVAQQAQDRMSAARQRAEDMLPEIAGADEIVRTASSVTDTLRNKSRSAELQWEREPVMKDQFERAKNTARRVLDSAVHRERVAGEQQLRIVDKRILTLQDAVAAVEDWMRAEKELAEAEIRLAGMTREILEREAREAAAHGETGRAQLAGDAAMHEADRENAIADRINFAEQTAADWNKQLNDAQAVRQIFRSSRKTRDAFNAAETRVVHDEKHVEARHAHSMAALAEARRRLVRIHAQENDGVDRESLRSATETLVAALKKEEEQLKHAHAAVKNAQETGDEESAVIAAMELLLADKAAARADAERVVFDGANQVLAGMDDASTLFNESSLTADMPSIFDELTVVAGDTEPAVLRPGYRPNPDAGSVHVPRIYRMILDILERFNPGSLYDKLVPDAEREAFQADRFARTATRIPGGLERLIADIHAHVAGYDHRANRDLQSLLGKAGPFSRILFGSIPDHCGEAYYSHANAAELTKDGSKAADERNAKNFADLYNTDPDLAARADMSATGVNVAEKGSVEYLSELLKKYPGIYKFVGEMTFNKELVTVMLGKNAFELGSDETAAFLAFAEESGIGVLMHSDWGKHGLHEEDLAPEAVQMAYEHVHEMTEVLGRYPNLNIVLAHSGIGRFVRPDYRMTTGIEVPDMNVPHAEGQSRATRFVKVRDRPVPMHAAMVRYMLESVPNARIDLSWNDVSDAITADPAMQKAIADVLIDFKGRIHFGSDTVKPVHDGQYFQALMTSAPLLYDVASRDPEALWHFLRGAYDSVMHTAERRTADWTARALQAERRQPEIDDMYAMLDDLGKRRQVLRDGARADFDAWIAKVQARPASATGASTAGAPYRSVYETRPKAAEHQHWEAGSRTGKGTPYGRWGEKHAQIKAAIRSLALIGAADAAIVGEALHPLLSADPVLLSAEGFAGRAGLMVIKGLESEARRHGWESMFEQGIFSDAGLNRFVNRIHKVRKAYGIPDDRILEIARATEQFRANYADLVKRPLSEFDTLPSDPVRGVTDNDRARQKFYVLMGEVGRYQVGVDRALGKQASSLSILDARTATGLAYRAAVGFTYMLNLVGTLKYFAHGIPIDTPAHAAMSIFMGLFAPANLALMHDTFVEMASGKTALQAVKAPLRWIMGGAQSLFVAGGAAWAAADALAYAGLSHHGAWAGLVTGAKVALDLAFAGLYVNPLGLREYGSPLKVKFWNRVKTQAAFGIALNELNKGVLRRQVADPETLAQPVYVLAAILAAREAITIAGLLAAGGTLGLPSLAAGPQQQDDRKDKAKQASDQSVPAMDPPAMEQPSPIPEAAQPVPGGTSAGNQPAQFILREGATLWETAKNIARDPDARERLFTSPEISRAKKMTEEEITALALAELMNLNHLDPALLDGKLSNLPGDPDVLDVGQKIVTSR